MDELIEYLMRFGLSRGALHRDLVGKSAGDDGGVVVCLGDQFLHLRDGVLDAVGHMAGGIGDLRPDQEAIPVTDIIIFIRVLVMGQTNGIGANFFHYIGVFDHILIGDGVSFPKAILMAGSTAQRQWLAVEDETFFGIDEEFAETIGLFDLIDDFLIHIGPGDDGI